MTQAFGSPLSDRNVIVPLRGTLPAELGSTLDGAVLLCLPNAIAVDVASRFSGDEAPSDDAINGVVLSTGQYEQ